ncbi:cobalamin-binding protein, partial [Streptomyces sp. NPDC001139]
HGGEQEVVRGGQGRQPEGRAERAERQQEADGLDRGLTRPDLPAVRQTVDDLPHLTDQEYTMVVGTRRELLKETLVGLEDRFPPMRAYSERQRQRTAEDIGHILDHLAASLYVADEDLFRDFIAWTADVLTARDVPARSLDPALELLAQRLQDFPRATRTLASARETLAAHSPEPRKPGDGQHA